LSKSKTLSDSFPLWRRWGCGWFPFWVYSYFVVRGSLLRPEEIPEFLERIHDKVLHAGEYFLLFFFAVNAFRVTKMDWLRLKAGVHALVYCLWVGGLTEWLQFYVPGRSTDFNDWLVDAAGAGLGLLLFRGITAFGESRVPSG
jgi:VanZ family protein